MSKVKFYEGLVVKKNNRLVITNSQLNGFVSRLWSKYGYRFDSRDEFMGSVAYLIWLQIERSDFDFDDLDEKTTNQVYKALTTMLNFQIYEQANKDMKRVDGNFVTIDFVSLDATIEEDYSIIESVEDSFFNSSRKSHKSEFMKWLDENQDEILSKKQVGVLNGLRSLPHEPTAQEMEEATGISSKNISTRINTMFKKIMKSWNERDFKYSRIYPSLMAELDEIERFLALEEDEDYNEFAFFAMSELTKLGDLFLEKLTHDELIEINVGEASRKTMYKLVDLVLERQEKLNMFIEQEKLIWEKNMNSKTISNTVQTKNNKTKYLKMNAYGALEESEMEENIKGI